MKKLVLLLSLGMVLSFSVSAMGGNAPAKSDSTGAQVKVIAPTATRTKLLIDDFESASLSSPREWWTFDLQTALPVSNNSLTAGDNKVLGEVGRYSLALAGKANNWYGGGAGTYIAKENQDLSVYDAIQLDIYGSGPGSGTLKIELIDDDNKNWQAEQDPKKNYTMVYDDKYVYDITVDWTGWKRVIVPFADLVDDNAAVGDDIWNISQSAGSGGLLQLQFICLGSKGDAGIKFNVDNIALIVEGSSK